MSLKTKLATFRGLAQQIENWPAAVIGQTFSKKGLTTLKLRNGVTVHYRRDTEDWQTVREVLLDGTYDSTFHFLKKESGPLLVLDLGANIGLFGLLAASLNPQTEVHCFEPAKNNIAMLEKNFAANPSSHPRLHIHGAAVGSADGTAEFRVNSDTPQMSGFFAKQGQLEKVEVRSFAKIIESFGKPISLVKMDVEGAEHEIVENTPASAWKNIRAVAMEIHPYPRGAASIIELVKRMEGFGFTAKEEAIGRGNYFFSRAV